MKSSETTKNLTWDVGPEQLKETIWQISQIQNTCKDGCEIGFLILEKLEQLDNGLGQILNKQLALERNMQTLREAKN